MEYEPTPTQPIVQEAATPATPPQADPRQQELSVSNTPPAQPEASKKPAGSLYYEGESPIWTHNPQYD